MALSASKSFAGSKTFGSSAGSASPARIYSSTPGVSAVYSQSVPSSPRVTSSAADEIRSLRSHNEALQRQLTLKDQGLERLRQKVHERALMLSHEKAADIQQTRREAGTVIEDLEAENARLRSDLAHRTSQLHSAVTRIAALNPITGELEEKDVLWFKTDFSRHVILANEDCELGDRTNGWTFALLKNWLRSAFVPVNRRFSVLQSVLQSCNGRLSAYFKTEPELSVEMTDDPRTRLIRAKARTEDSFRLQQTSVDASGLLLTRPNSFVPAIDIVRDNALYTIIMDVPGMTSDDIRLSRQNVTTIVKGTRLRPYPELLVQKVERQERQYGDFTLTFKVPQEYERKFDSVTVVDGVLRLTFKPDADEESVAIR